jgi:hypothetical protein
MPQLPSDPHLSPSFPALYTARRMNRTSLFYASLIIKIIGREDESDESFMGQPDYAAFSSPLKETS